MRFLRTLRRWLRGRGRSTGEHICVTAQGAAYRRFGCLIKTEPDLVSEDIARMYSGE